MIYKIAPSLRNILVRGETYTGNFAMWGRTIIQLWTLGLGNLVTSKKIYLVTIIDDFSAEYYIG